MFFDLAKIFEAAIADLYSSIFNHFFYRSSSCQHSAAESRIYKIHFLVKIGWEQPGNFKKNAPSYIYDFYQQIRPGKLSPCQSHASPAS